MKTVFIKSYGCQMNVYDSQRMGDLLAGEGYIATDKPDNADLILLNTCHIREKASEKVFSELGRMKVFKDYAKSQGKQVKIGVTGCVAQAEGDEILRRSKVVDLVVGPQSYHNLPALLKESGKQVLTDFPLEDKFDVLPKPLNNRGFSAFVTVQEGCDKFCTFCVVPYTRGSEVSRPVAKILQEINALVENGVKEISLLGQNVNAYHGEGDNGAVTLPQLLDIIAKTTKVERLRYTTSHPNDMTKELIDAHKYNEKLMPTLHLPVQSGSDRILAAMNRKHTRDDYLRIIEKVRQARPDMAFSSDFIIGFPSESDQDFQDTLDIIEQVGYSQCYSFKYSTRPGTPGANLPNQIDEAVKNTRLSKIQGLLNLQADDFANDLLGRTIDVLFEKKGRELGQISGKSPYLTPVQIIAPDSLIGTVQRVKLTARGTFSHHGDLIA